MESVLNVGDVSYVIFLYVTILSGVSDCF